MTIQAELQVGSGYLEVIVHYNIVKHNGHDQAEFDSVEPDSPFYFFRPTKIAEITRAAIEWVSENNLTLTSYGDILEPRDDSDLEL